MKKKAEDITTSQLPTELLSLLALNPFAKHNSSARSVMFASHFSQRLVIRDSTERLVYSGLEREFGKHTFSITMPENGRILKVIPRYPKGVGQEALKHNPETIVVYEVDETKEIDYFSLPYYASYHQFFGFKYENRETTQMIRPGVYIPKGTVFATPNSVGDNESFKYGINLNVALLTLPATSEDGVVISRDVLPKMRFRVYETRTVEIGTNEFPLNLYGSVDIYKPFPEIGDPIREDGLLVAMREIDQDLAPVEMGIRDTTKVDFIFDKGVYVRGPGGRVVDIKVIGSNSPNKQMSDRMAGHINKYEKALLRFHQEIINTEKEIRLERKKKFNDGKANFSPRFHRLVVDSMAITDHETQQKHNQTLGLLYRKVPIGIYRITFVIEYELEPTIGFKITGMSGDL